MKDLAIQQSPAWPTASQ